MIDYLTKSESNDLWIFKKGRAIENTQRIEIAKEQNDSMIFYLGFALKQSHRHTQVRVAARQ